MITNNLSTFVKTSICNFLLIFYYSGAPLDQIL